MSGKLDQSLDEIMKDRKPAAGGRRGKGRLPPRKAASKSKAATAAVMAPSGGIQKNKASKNTKGKVPAAVVSHSTGDSKISVSGLPEDVNEGMIKDYFVSAVAPVKHVILNYGPNGRSRGSAVVIFSKPTGAAEAVKLDGTRVDGKAMRVEVLVGAKNVAAPAPPKSLHDRMAKPKNAAQEKTKGKSTTGKPAANGGGQGLRGKKKSGRVGRPKPKTTEELDAEMHDYFGGDASGAAAVAVAQPAAATNGVDTGMVDEVM